MVASQLQPGLHTNLSDTQLQKFNQMLVFVSQNNEFYREKLDNISFRAILHFEYS
ncbi:hypothetical protein [Peribacillus sp. TH24]|jgi:phenylacetate-CoA ligase|uniref:hypothetical protein n=1 Tax=Peribacillus sp. TH24 TaxID=2798483 RepID=UPI0019113CFF|nr:hypothetical protein [Peribacillus sp. TH24]MBK5445308.1 hypothetical protein [Peribacillus sp. TH24]